MIEAEEISIDLVALRKMIEDEWVEGTIKMLRVSPESCGARGLGTSTTAAYDNDGFRGTLD